MSPRTRPALLLVALAVLSISSLPARAERDAVVPDSLERIRHGPALPASATGLKSARHQDHHKRGDEHDDSDDRHPRPASNANNHEPHGRDPQGASHAHAPPAGKRDEPPSAPPAYTPIVTPAPDQDAALASQGYKQLTYYACNTVAGSEHCGWHLPVVKAQGVRRDSATVWLVVGCLAGVFALGLM
ncbi:uncharacterized protein MAM_07283 [Metarhizium album ARSEF 1941]|uniref:Uncharacterized protein n=1 Tax=Metarhizium album (strain ARSEF 1941) TaxID=1081103 RepID=A0A0B2WMG4_METAS|nr:uncharacterized protein MAM_07283 [Metarhizium album ARSEF 1941]KHN94864.1 hypothetical protein MAM_07283 [Metarhizium album ARSEF 1941]